MKRLYSLLALALTVATVGAQPTTSSNAITAGTAPHTYTTQSDFVKALGTNFYYLNDFRSLNGARTGELDFSRQGMSYGISAPPDGLLITGQGTNEFTYKFTCSYTDQNDLMVSLTNVTAVGALFFLADGWGYTVNGTVRVTFSDGVQTNVPSPSFIARDSGGAKITSMVVHTTITDGNHFPSIRDICVSNPKRVGNRPTK